MKWTLKDLLLGSSLAAMVTVMSCGGVTPKTRYGLEDDRIDPGKITDPRRSVCMTKTGAEAEAKLIASRAAVMLVYAEPDDEGRLRLPQSETLKERRNLCPGVRYADELSVADCSGVLLTDQVVATVYHCIKPSERRQLWAVFDFLESKKLEPGSLIDEADAYRVTPWKSSQREGWALLRLENRRVCGHTPASIRPPQSPYVSEGESVFAAGHPDGIPLKITCSGTSSEDRSGQIVTNLDLFKGNSGSPIFADDGERQLIGLATSGRDDYRSDYHSAHGYCAVIDTCLPPDCSAGERAVSTAIVYKRLVEDDPFWHEPPPPGCPSE